MESSSSKLRSSSSLPNVLLSSLNLLLFALSSASFAPIFLLRPRPTSFGWALFAVSAATLLSSLLGFYSHLTHHLCFVTHVSLVMASCVGQALGFLALLLRPGPSLRLLEPERSSREARALARIEEGLLVGMFVVQSAVLVAACMVQRWWVMEYEGAEMEREKAAWRRSRRMARVQEESMANAEAAALAEAKEMEERVRSKHVQWVKNGIEG